MMNCNSTMQSRLKLQDTCNMYVYSEQVRANDPCELLPVKKYDEQQEQVICGIV